MENILAHQRLIQPLDALHLKLMLGKCSLDECMCQG
jgi:hypothetical protein